MGPMNLFAGQELRDRTDLGTWEWGGEEKGEQVERVALTYIHYHE